MPPDAREMVFDSHEKQGTNWPAISVQLLAVGLVVLGYSAIFLREKPSAAPVKVVLYPAMDAEMQPTL